MGLRSGTVDCDGLCVMRVSYARIGIFRALFYNRSSLVGFFAVVDLLSGHNSSFGIDC